MDIICESQILRKNQWKKYVGRPTTLVEIIVTEYTIVPTEGNFFENGVLDQPDDSVQKVWQ